ncbi:MAG: hypothetical protein WCC72_10130, partial [Dehalococcoidales bacterium]
MKKLMIMLIILTLSTSTIIGCATSSHYSSSTSSPTNIADTAGWVSQENPSSYPVPLWDIWGSSGSDVFAVGGLGTILKYNGKTWTNTSSGTTNDLWGVWG